MKLRPMILMIVLLILIWILSMSFFYTMFHNLEKRIQMIEINQNQNVYDFFGIEKNRKPNYIQRQQQQQQQQQQQLKSKSMSPQLTNRSEHSGIIYGPHGFIENTTE